MGKYRIADVEDVKSWDAFVEASPQGTIFSKSIYLEALGRPYELLWVLKGEEQKAGVVVLLSEDGRRCELDDLVIYGGLLFCDDSEMQVTKARTERFRITECVIDELDRRYDGVELALSPQLEDLRPFLWHNYHSSQELEKFRVDLRYTSYIDISELNQNIPEEETALFQELEVLRRRNIREARKDGADVTEERATEHFIEFYSALMVSQGEMVPEDKLIRMRDLIDRLLDDEVAVMTVAKNAKGEVLYITVFCLDGKRAYYLFGAGNPKASERYQGTMGFWDTFKILASKHGVAEVDFEGVNSPKRGWFKLSFGGSLLPYYKVALPVGSRRGTTRFLEAVSADGG